MIDPGLLARPTKSATEPLAGEYVQYVRSIGQLALLVALVAFSGNSYAASRSETTLHITVTLVSTIATGPAPVEQSHVASSENQGIIYNLRPDTEQTVADAVIGTSQTKAQEEEVRTNISYSSKNEPIVELTTVVMK